MWSRSISDGQRRVFYFRFARNLSFSIVAATLGTDMNVNVIRRPEYIIIINGENSSRLAVTVEVNLNCWRQPILANDFKIAHKPKTQHKLCSSLLVHHRTHHWSPNLFYYSCVSKCTQSKAIIKTKSKRKENSTPLSGSGSGVRCRRAMMSFNTDIYHFSLYIIDFLSDAMW